MGSLFATLIPSVRSAPTIVFTNHATISANDYQYEGADIVVTNCTLTMDGVHALGNLDILRGGRLTHTGGAHGPTLDRQSLLGAEPLSGGLTLIVAGNTYVAQGGAVDLKGKGYDSAQGPGAGKIGVGTAIGGGAGYGGYGGDDYSHAAGGIIYGDMTQPIDRGSGGGSYNGVTGSSGGGAIKLVTGGQLRLEGELSANGDNGTNELSGGGSGGSIWLKAQTLVGTGLIMANGGDGEPSRGGGGAGGRIALAAITNEFAGILLARGGKGAGAGGAGTIYLPSSNQSAAHIIVDNGGYAGTNTVVSALNAADLTVRNGARVLLPAAATLHRLEVATNGWLLITNHDLTILGEAVIQAGGGILGGTMNVDFAGGESSDPFRTGGGGGYGGYGASSAWGAAGGRSYGTIDSPSYRGSAGGSGIGNSPTNRGGASGGYVRINAQRRFTINGKLFANGEPGLGLHSGGGSGGSIWLSADELAGSGVISANGGAGNGLGGGGGGGRIALFFRTNLFTGGVSTYGGLGQNLGGAGTIYTKTLSASAGSLLLDNGGRMGTNTGPVGETRLMQITVKAGAILESIGYLDGHLLIASNAWLFPSNRPINIQGDVTIQEGGGIIVDGCGYRGGQGPGAGGNYGGNYRSGGGGGNGGRGGTSGSGASGGVEYGDLSRPTGFGSGGGNTLSFTSSTNSGGPGGGAIQLVVTGRLWIDGRISANAGNPVGPHNGGGSGGNIWLTVGQLAGNGVICAHGSLGNGLGGGGGGGRIAIEYATNDFTGKITAHGGVEYNPGGAGTIYTKSTRSASGHLLIDDDGQNGPDTLINGYGPFGLTVKGKAVMAPVSSVTFEDLLVTSNGFFTISNTSLRINGNAVIEAGGTISADGKGYSAGSGPGGGRWVYIRYWGTSGSGGGYGGFGSPSAMWPGGSTYGSLSQPMMGSGGGSVISGYSNPTNGSAGGGVLSIETKGTLQVEGRISAQGQDGVALNSGGGSGGGIWLNAGTLAGHGMISANGGKGSFLGGGGGGGRITILYRTNAYAGGWSAFGGGGYESGGAGTIYAKSVNDNYCEVRVDNGGAWSTNTPVPGGEPFSLTVSGGAGVYPSASFWTLNNLRVGPGGRVTSKLYDSNLDLLVLTNAVIEAGGLISVDGMGWMTGPGAGPVAQGIGSGAGYGGRGGASSLLPGGSTYGSETQPVDRGSVGGGGAIRFNVGGTLQVDGQLRANGLDGLDESSGGGSGGSLWITAGAFAGAGLVSADGGAGELYAGGGGGGGRIAIYARSRTFSGLVSVTGGDGYAAGEEGTIYYATNLPALAVITQTPDGVISNAVSMVTVGFNAAVRPHTFDPADFIVTTPSGRISPDQIQVLAGSSTVFNLIIPLQTNVGDYAITVGPQIEDLYGQSMLQPYAGAFSLAPLWVTGRVTNEYGQPVPGVLLQAGAELAAAATDTNGQYALSVPPTSTFTITPARSGWMFVPSSRAYTELWSSIPDQNFLAVTQVAPQVNVRMQTTNVLLHWSGLPGVSYQLLRSTNLVDWIPGEGVTTDRNGVIQLLVPAPNDPVEFFRLRADW